MNNLMNIIERDSVTENRPEFHVGDTVDLKIRIKESERPVGVKKSTKMKLPPEDYVYGFKPKSDPEGVDTSK